MSRAKFTKPACYTKPNCTCKVCGFKFHKPPSQVLRGAGKYCSRVCHMKGRKPWVRPTAEIRFRKRLGQKTSTGCIPWIGSGSILVSGKSMSSYRLAWQLTHGKIAEGMHVCHHCDNPRCVNVEHLFLGTHQDNMTDRNLKNRMDAKLTPDQVREIRAKAVAGKSQKELAAEYGVCQSNVSCILLQKSWKHVS